MPIIAESQPIPVTVTEGPTTTPPVPYITPTVPTQPLPETPLVITPGNVVERHKQFINLVNKAPACFDKTAIVGFSGQEFDLHLQIAVIDKYLTNTSEELYCSKQAIQNLSNALKRTQP